MSDFNPSYWTIRQFTTGGFLTTHYGGPGELAILYADHGSPREAADFLFDRLKDGDMEDVEPMFDHAMRMVCETQGELGDAWSYLAKWLREYLNEQEEAENENG